MVFLNFQFPEMEGLLFLALFPLTLNPLPLLPAEVNPEKKKKKLNLMNL